MGRMGQTDFVTVIIEFVAAIKFECYSRETGWTDALRLSFP